MSYHHESTARKLINDDDDLEHTTDRHAAGDLWHKDVRFAHTPLDLAMKLEVTGLVNRLKVSQVLPIPMSAEARRFGPD